jgi:hypothetical protein
VAPTNNDRQDSNVEFKEATVRVLFVGSSKNTGHMVLRALAAHQTPNLTACKGTYSVVWRDLWLVSICHPGCLHHRWMQTVPHTWRLHNFGFKQSSGYRFFTPAAILLLASCSEEREVIGH